MVSENKAPEVLYSDELVQINKDGLILHNYYLTGGDREVPFTEIEKITMQKPNVWNGKWRIWGTGFPRIWYPYDGNRMYRDRIFFIFFKGKKFKIGFTTKDSNAVEILLRQRNLVKA